MDLVDISLLLGTIMNLFKDVSDILKLCICFDEEEQSVFYKTMAFSNLEIFQVLISRG